MMRPHSAPWGGKCRARDGASQVVIGIGVAAGKMGTGEAKDGLDLNSGAALQQQVLGNPKIYDAPVRLREAFRNMPSLHTTLVDRGGLCGAGCATIRGGPVNREGRGRRWYRWLPEVLQQRFGAGRQTRMGADKFYPRGVAAQGASCRFLIGESDEPSQVTPVGAGGITSIGPRQPLAGSGRHRRFQRENTEANPGLQMVRTGLQDHTRIMPVGAHVRDHARPRNIQIDQNVASVLLSTVGLNIHIATFQVASAQEPNRGCVGQLVGGPEPFARKGPMSLVVNQTNEVQLMRHCRELPANTLQSDPESAVVHNRHSVAATKRRTMDFRQTARCVLTGCLSPGGRSRSITSAFLLPSRTTLTGSFAAAGAVWRRLLFGASFFRLPFAGATWAAGFATFANKTWIAIQIRSTATFRFVNFFTGLRSVNGATPAKLFQISTGRVRGQEATSLANSREDPKYSAL